MAKVKQDQNAEAKTDSQDVKEENSNKKKNKKDVDNDSPKKKKKGKAKIIIFFILFILILGMIGAILFFNAFNIREKYLRSTIDKIPIVRNIIPKAPDSSETTTEKKASVEELEAKIADLESQIKAKDITITTLTDDNEKLQLENTRLKEIESQQVQFKEDKAKFDEMIANNDPQAYSSFYENIAPENAENLYKQTKESAEKQKELKKYTDTFETIDPAAGALVMEEMVGTDINLASMILKNIDSEQTAKIIAAMDPTKAASLVKYMAPA